MTTAPKILRTLIGFGAMALAAKTAFAQTTTYGSTTPITLTQRSYTQNFDSLGATGTTGSALPVGWRVREEGSNANTGYTVGTGSSNAGDSYNFGASGSSDRALGYLPSGSLDRGDIGAFFTNALGGTITSLAIAFNGEQYRNGAATNVLAFSYSLNATGLSDNQGTWTAFSPLNFTSPNSATFSSTPIGATISGLSIATGGSFAIRWTGLDQSSTDDALAIDDVVLNATVVPEPASWLLAIMGFGMVGGALRSARRRAVFA
ncbi:PEPxxWA-CTERM sorting domain-containing protein [Sphingomonas sp. RS2018]